MKQERFIFPILQRRKPKQRGLNSMPEDKQLVSGEPGFQPRQSGSRAHALNKYYAASTLCLQTKESKSHTTVLICKVFSLFGF